jgi:amidohydrolase
VARAAIGVLGHSARNILRLVPEQLASERSALEPELIETRRALHRQPELAFAEYRTAELVAQRLRSLGLEPRMGVGGTGVVADIDGVRPGPTLLLRADMDALPLDEIPGRPYGSEVPGRMHACGHDAHTSALLGAATLLTSRIDAIAGRVRLIFQPAEEIGAGAAAMIADGALDGVDEALAAHVFSPIPFGVVGTRAGELMVGLDVFELVIEGGGGHSGIAHQSRDAVFAAAQLVSALQSIAARETAPSDTLVLTIASIDGGTAANIVAGTVTLRGTLRWLGQAVRERALERMRQIADGVSGALRVTADLRIQATVPKLRCSETSSALLADAGAAAGTTVIDPGVVPASEDFAHLADRVPAGFILVGAGGKGCGAHHAPDFDIDERAIGVTAELLARAALTRLAPAT